MKKHKFIFREESFAVYITVWLPSENSCGDVTSGLAVTVMAVGSLSVAVTGAQATVAVFFPLSAKTVRGFGQVSPKEGACKSYITKTINQRNKWKKK